MFRLNAFHFLAKVASSEALIEYNDTKEVDENIDMLENDIEQLSIDELSQAGERMQSGDTVYAAFMKEDIDSLLASLDLSNSHNYVNAFITLAEDQNESEMYSMARDYSEKLEKHPLHKLDALKETVSTHSYRGRTGIFTRGIATLNKCSRNTNTNIGHVSRGLCG